MLNNTITILGLVFNKILRVCVWGGYMTNEHENLHFGNEHNIHMSSNNYEESGYDLDLDLLTTLY